MDRQLSCAAGLIAGILLGFIVSGCGEQAGRSEGEGEGVEGEGEGVEGEGEGAEGEGEGVEGEGEGEGAEGEGEGVEGEGEGVEGEGEGQAPGCRFHQDCPGARCSASGECVPALACRSAAACPLLDSICAQGRCLPRCLDDRECPADGWCVLGQCQRWTAGSFGEPWRPGAHAPLRAGVGEVPLDIPVGITPAGYGGRPGPRTPYSPGGMGGSTGVYDRPMVRALALDSGDERLILLRLPLCFTVDELMTAIARQLARRTGTDYRGRILGSSPHSHSNPGRFWNVFSDLGLGILGHGQYSSTISERMAASAAEAIAQALADLRPAALGHRLLHDFDLDDHITSRRRGEWPAAKDTDLLLLRVDDLSAGPPGVPMALWFRFAMHGTILMEPRLSGDAPAGAEGVTRERLEAHFGRPLSVAFLQGNAADVSPRGDDRGHVDTQKTELIGVRVADVIEPLVDGIVTSSDVALGVAVRRVPVNRQALGYADDEFYTEPRYPGDPYAGPFRLGALLCVGSGDSDPATRWEDGRLGCSFILEEGNARRPVVQVSHTVLAAARLGSLLLLTLPGEPTGELGREAVSKAQAELPWAGDVTTLGYAMDHQLYLTLEDDWFQGGYEASMGLWGWRMGRYVVDQVVRTAEHLLPGAPPPEPGLFRDPWFGDLPEQFPYPAPEPTDGVPGAVTLEPPAQVARLDLVEVRFNGGHPGIDLPTVSLEQDDAGSWRVVTLPGGRPYDSLGFHFVIDYLGDFAAGAQPWRLLWEERPEFPAGRYRFVVRGQHWTGETSEPYRVESRAFWLTPRTMAATVTAFDQATGTVEARLLYPAVPSNDDGVSDFEGLRALGFRLRSAEVDGRFGGPAPRGDGMRIEPVVRDAAGELRPCGPGLLEAGSYSGALVVARRAGVEQRQERGGLPATTLRLQFSPGGAGAPYTLQGAVSDPWGNRWSLAATSPAD